VYAFHVPNGGLRPKSEARVFASIGVRRGVPDVIAIHRGQVFALEIKTENGRATDAQWQAIEDLRAAGAHAVIVYGLDRALAQLEAWGLLRGKAAITNTARGGIGYHLKRIPDFIEFITKDMNRCDRERPDWFRRYAVQHLLIAWRNVLFDVQMDWAGAYAEPSKASVVDQWAKLKSNWTEEQVSELAAHHAARALCDYLRNTDQNASQKTEPGQGVSGGTDREHAQ
jgi:hypothetical protein